MLTNPYREPWLCPWNSLEMKHFRMKRCLSVWIRSGLSVHTDWITEVTHQLVCSKWKKNNPPTWLYILTCTECSGTKWKCLQFLPGYNYNDFLSGKLTCGSYEISIATLQCWLRCVTELKLLQHHEHSDQIFFRPSWCFLMCNCNEKGRKNDGIENWFSNGAMGPPWVACSEISKCACCTFVLGEVR